MRRPSTNSAAQARDVGGAWLAPGTGPAAGTEPDLAPVPQTDRWFSVRGGIGGIHFQWEELERAEGTLRILAEAAGAVCSSLLYIAADLDRQRFGALSPAGIPVDLLAGPGAGCVDPMRAGYAAAAAVTEASASVAYTARELETAADRLRASRTAYEIAEALAAAAVLSASRSAEGVARAAAEASRRQGLLVPRPLELRPHPGPPGDVPFAGTVGALITRIEAVEAEAPGSFEILRTGPDEGPVYIVVLPGTQGTETDSLNPFDLSGNAEAVNQDSRFVAAAVARALEASGASTGDQVVIAGYSQGGLHAMNLAAETALGGEYDVQLVVTAGSPTGWEGSTEAEYLHLEHRKDAVPLVDAAANPDETQRVTVTLDSAVPARGTDAEGRTEGKGLGTAHKLAAYEDGARFVDASSLASLAPSAAILAAAGTSGAARRYLYQAVRVPQLPPPQPPPDAASDPVRRRGGPSGNPPRTERGRR